MTEKPMQSSYKQLWTQQTKQAVSEQILKNWKLQKTYGKTQQEFQAICLAFLEELQDVDPKRVIEAFREHLLQEKDFPALCEIAALAKKRKHKNILDLTPEEKEGYGYY